MATHSSTLAWKIPWTEEPGRPEVHGVAKSRTRLSNFTFTFMHWRRKWQPTPVFLPGESQGWQSLVGCCLWGRTESDMAEVTQQQQQQQIKSDLKKDINSVERQAILSTYVSVCYFLKTFILKVITGLETLDSRKLHSQQEFAVWLRDLKPGLCNNLEEQDEEKVGGRFKREGTHVYWFMLIQGRNQHNSVKQLSFN